MFEFGKFVLYLRNDRICVKIFSGINFELRLIP